MWEQEFQEILQNHLERMREKNHRFSMRAFARRLQLSPGTLSDLLKAKCRLKPQRAAEVLRLLSLEEKELTRLLVMMGQPVEISRRELLSFDEQFLVDWLYTAVLIAFDLDSSHRSPAQLARKFDVPVERIEAVIQNLLEKGLLIRDVDGGLQKAPAHWTTTDGVANEAIRLHHKTNLQLADRILDRVPAEERDFTSMTFVGSREQISSVRQEIRELYKKVSVQMEYRDAPKDVFRLSVSLFPLDLSPRNVE